ncbi:MAG: hypothetical protein EPN36_03450 [Rhodanobacteraceae bacterium]|nr:MAG: hypothetical protein EPN36_03450 [Rhodanobacteraceae bacterium]
MLVVVLQGGVVQSVISDDPKCPIREVTVIDYDTEGAGAKELCESAQMVPQADGSEVAAFVCAWPVTDAEIGLNGLRDITQNDLEARWGSATA